MSELDDTIRFNKLLKKLKKINKKLNKINKKLKQSDKDKEKETRFLYD